MQLTNRQLFILSYLLNHTERISGEHLASQVGISLRTLQSEIQEINQKLSKGVRIDASGRRGYIVEGVTTDIRAELLEQARDR